MYPCRILILILVAILGCNRVRQVESRLTLAAVDVQSNDFAWQEIPGVFDAFSGDACQVLADLTEGSGQFKLFHTLEKSAVLTGKVSLTNNPFIQAIISEKVVVPAPDKALQYARVKFESGTKDFTDQIEWDAAQCFYHVGYGPLEGFDEIICDGVFLFLGRARAQDEFMSRVYAAVNEEAARQFPGVFGAAQGVEGSLYDNLTQNATAFGDASVRRTFARLSNEEKKLFLESRPLFAGSSWAAHRDETRKVAPAVLAAFYASSNSTQRVCGLTLAIRMFSQQIVAKGFAQPIFQNESSGDAAASLPVFSQAHRQLSRRSVAGVFANAQGRKVEVKSTELASYDPHKNPLKLLTRKNIGASTSSETASLKEFIAFLESLTYQFILTSPAEPWVAGGYLLGDISDTSAAKILPEETHTLALGLLTMNLKNMQTLYMRKLNIAGQNLRENEAVGGVVFANPQDLEKGIAVFQLDELLDLTRTVIFLTISLERIAAASGGKHPVYKPEVLDLLVNTKNPQSALKGLQELHAGLAILLLRMADERNCYQRGEWNLGTGNLQISKPCGASLRSSYKETLHLLAERTKSPLLLERSEKFE